MAGRFEHRLFLSATPHNGHSNSFSTLLELLDPYRFTRGVKVRGRKALEDVMVRRLKEDIRATQGGFPERRVERVVIDGLPSDAPELELSGLLDEIPHRPRGTARADRLKREIEAADLDEMRRQVTEEELEAARDRRDELDAQVERCRGLLERSRNWVGFEAARFRQALSCALELLGADPLARSADGNGGGSGKATWTFPALDRRTGADPTWAATLDALRPPRKSDQKLADWRRELPIRPVVFEGRGRAQRRHRAPAFGAAVAQRLPARFRAQGFVYHDLSRACLAQAKDSIPRVILLGRLCLYGRRAERLHEELVPLAARWIEQARRSGPLKAYAREAETRTLDLLEQSLTGRLAWAPARRHPQPPAGRRTARRRGTSAAARAAGRGTGRAGGAQVGRAGRAGSARSGRDAPPAARAHR